jgi:hypothetical protein
MQDGFGGGGLSQGDKRGRGADSNGGDDEISAGNHARICPAN